MNTYRYTPLLLLLVPIALLSSCKPTEKNYQEAYAVAQHKKASLKTDPDLDLSMLIAEGEPNLRKFGEMEVYFASEPLKTVFSSHPGAMYNVAVGCYRMRANAEAQSERLSSDGFDAFVAEGKGEKLYVVCGGAGSVEEAEALLKSFTSHYPEATYPGLDGHPVMIMNTALRP